MPALRGDVDDPRLRSLEGRRSIRVPVVSPAQYAQANMLVFQTHNPPFSPTTHHYDAANIPESFPAPPCLYGIQ
jgi:hypothetical protein